MTILYLFKSWKVQESLMPDLEMFSAHMTLQNGKKEAQINTDPGGKSSIKTFQI